MQSVKEWITAFLVVFGVCYLMFTMMMGVGVEITFLCDSYNQYKKSNEDNLKTIIRQELLATLQYEQAKR